MKPQMTHHQKNEKINIGLIIVFSILIVMFGVIIQKNVSLPSIVLLAIGIPSLVYLLLAGFNKPELILYVLVIYLPFSKILVGDFGGAATAVNLTNILTILGIISWFLNSAIKNRKFYTRTSLDIPLLVFIFFGILSLIKGVSYFSFGHAFDYIIPLKRWLTPTFFFFITFNNVRDKESIKNTVIIMLLVLTIVALMAIKDYMDVGAVSSIEKSRIGGIAQQPNILAAFFVYYMFLFGGFILVYWRRCKYWLLFLPFLACFRGLQVTFSRGGYLAFVAAGLAIAFFKNKILFIVVLSGLIIAIFNPFILPEGIRYRLSSTFSNEQIYTSSIEEVVDKSALTRINIWKGGVQMIKDNPWFGVGYGLFPSFIPSYAPDVGKRDAHSYYILIAAEMGIFALMIFLLILLIILKNTYKLYKITKDKFFKAMSLGWLGGLGGVFIANIFGGRLDSQEVSSYFWIITALIFRGLYIEKMEQHNLSKKIKHHHA